MSKLFKAITYRLFGTGTTILISFILTKELKLSIGIGVFELIGKILLYWMFEILWEKIFTKLQTKKF